MALDPSTSKINRPQQGFEAQRTSDLPGYFDNYLGRSAASSIVVEDGDLVRLPDQPCKYAMLSHWNILDSSAFPLRPVSGDSLYENAGQEIYYGFNGVLAAQLFPSQSTGLLPVGDLNQICIRTRPGTSATVFYAWFW